MQITKVIVCPLIYFGSFGVVAPAVTAVIRLAHEYRVVVNVVVLLLIERDIFVVRVIILNTTEPDR